MKAILENYLISKEVSPSSPTHLDVFTFGGSKKGFMFIGIYAILSWVALLSGVKQVTSCPQAYLLPESKKDTVSVITVGAERLDTVVETLHQKRVALLVNHTSVVGDRRLIDTLLNRGIDIKKIFCPEHGCVGIADAGETVGHSTDASTGLPILSLYGNNKKPTREQLEDVDVVVFDIQDVGVRFYTYISTLQYVMEACAEIDKTVMVLDRPNPNGEYIDGPVLEAEFRSFVGLNPIPIVHGMTVGELAHMINGEGWLQDGIKVSLEVVTMLHYTHSTPYSPPIAPSPNLPTQNAIKWYPSICLFEGTTISVGRGTHSPFEVIGNPDLSVNFSFQFTPKSIVGMVKNPLYKNITCYGINLQGSKPKAKIDLKHLINLFKKYPDKDKDKFFNSFFNKLAGNSKLQEQIRKGMNEKEIRASWAEGLDKFKKIRIRYLLYPD